VIVAELEPGTVMKTVLGTGTCICHQPHPFYPGLELVLWVLDDGGVCFDALHPQQEIGEPVACDREGAKDRFMEALRVRK
jgi:hypothetical protein